MRHCCAVCSNCFLRTFKPKRRVSFVFFSLLPSSRVFGRPVRLLIEEMAQMAAGHSHYPPQQDWQRNANESAVVGCECKAFQGTAAQLFEHKIKDCRLLHAACPNCNRPLKKEDFHLRSLYVRALCVSECAIAFCFRVQVCVFRCLTFQLSHLPFHSPSWERIFRFLPSRLCSLVLFTWRRMAWHRV